MIMLGNLTVEQFEKRCKITLSKEEREIMNELCEQTCDNVDGNNKIHIYDIPFMIVCGNAKARKTIIDILTPYAGDLKATLQIGGGV